MDFEEWRTLIQHAQSSERAHAADQLPDSGERTAIVDCLLACLSDPVPIVRACAADTLCEFPVPEVRQGILFRLKQETDDLVVGYLVQSLSAMKNPDDLPTILEHTRKDTPKAIRVRALCGLVESTVSISIAELVRLCDDSDGVYRGLAFQALHSIRQTMCTKTTEIVDSAMKHKDDTEISALARPYIDQIIQEN
jgi:HEAT repeat